jgi:hypothetical protein
VTRRDRQRVRTAAGEPDDARPVDSRVVEHARHEGTGVGQTPVGPRRRPPVPRPIRGEDANAPPTGRVVEQRPEQPRSGRPVQNDDRFPVRVAVLRVGDAPTAVRALGDDGLQFPDRAGTRRG